MEINKIYSNKRVTWLAALSVFIPKNLWPVSGEPNMYPKARESTMSCAMNDILCIG